MPGIMDFFKPNAAPAAPATPAAQGATGAPSANANSNPLVPNATNTPPAIPDANGNPVEAPMDAFKDLWQTPATGGAENNQLFNIDPVKVQAAVSKLNFAGVLKPEELAAIAAGGEQAQAALPAILNKVAQASMATSLAQTAGLIQQAVDKNNAAFEARIPGLIKSQNLSELNQAENPLFSNPATQPLMKAVEQQIALKFPTATAAELKKHTQDYITGMFNLSKAPETQAAATKAASTDTDWATFFA